MNKPDIENVTIVAVHRLNNSTNGNPRYRIHLSNGYADNSQSDASFCYGVSNVEMRGPVNVWLTRGGKIADIRPVSA